MKRNVVDWSVCVKWFSPTRRRTRERTAALELLEQVHSKKMRLLQPSIWRTHVVARLPRKRGIAMHNAVEALFSLQSKELSNSHVLRNAADMASRLDADVFDTIYHALAIDRGVELITANAAYVERARHLGYVRLLSDWAARSRIAERDNSYSHRRVGVSAVRHKKR